MRAYYFDNLPGDPRLPHDSARPVTSEHLKSLNVETWHIPLTDDYEDKIDAIAREREYKNRDTINVTKEGFGDAYEEKIKMFFQEHLHEDEEIRYLISGSCYFDVRGKAHKPKFKSKQTQDNVPLIEAPSDSWIRVVISAGDLIVLPPGIYHRFTLDEGNKVEAMRLFKDAPKWAAINRSPESDLNEHRVGYLKSISQAA
ncbi:1,2-dihydroxy-3-keto-5-methylthiopentene dioxygenase [Marasmius tenuissimus]|uniref:Acireductone dioxygenase n=1 Tax=Marasmius tenuissimus TaxID=585030 RepID=A0ABR2ZR66_9AGAR